MGFQKKNIRIRSEIVDFFGLASQTVVFKSNGTIIENN
jgi:hypothetical protein